MGYTHYFKQSKPVADKQWEAFEKDAKMLIEHAPKYLGIVLTSNDSNGVIINAERINMNGDSERGLDHETFYMEKDYKDFNFCKTNHKPYDLIVCSLLLLANEHMPNHHDIGSDGGFEDWKESMELNAKLFGRAFKLPKSVDSSEEADLFEQELTQRYVKTTTKDIYEDKKSVGKGSRFNL